MTSFSDYRPPAHAAPTTKPRPAPPPDSESLTETINDPPVVGRFAELTFAAFHRADGSGGGWQVKDIRGELGEDEQRRLVSRVATRLDVDVTLPEFLVKEEVAALPRRLVYGPVPEQPGAVAYWHAVPAGTNSSNRPGNVFSHVLLDRAPAQVDPPLRPSDLIGAPAWLRPFGADEVLDTSLAAGPTPPWPAGRLDRAATVAFLRDAAIYRNGTLACLLDAAVQALQGGPTAVLGVDDPERAECWIAALCHVMAPGTSRALFWSTAERANRVADARSAGLHLVAVPLADLDALEVDDDTAVLIGDTDDAVTELGDLESGPHRTRHGSTIPVTPWSALVPVVSGLDADAATAVLAQQDEIAASIGDLGDLPCGWPLAVAVTELQIAGAVDEAELLVGSYAPARATPGTRAHAARRQVLERDLGVTAADAWEAWSDPARRQGRDGRGLADVYLRRAVGDTAWLCHGPGPVPVPGPVPGAPDGETLAAARAAIEALDSAPAGPDGMVPVVAGVRLLDLVSRAELVDTRDRTAGFVARRLLDRAGQWLLDAAGAGRLADLVGPVGEAVQAAFVRPWFDQHLTGIVRRPGCRLHPTTLTWLFPEEPRLDVPRLSRTAEEAVSATVLEAAAQATLVWGDPSAARAFAVAADLTARDVPEPVHAVHRAGTRPALPIEHVRELLIGFGWEPLLPLLPNAILAARDDDRALDAVLQRLTAGPLRPSDRGENAVLLAVELREMDTTWSTGRRPEAEARTAARLLDVAEEVLARDPAATLQEFLRASVTAAHVIERVAAELPTAPRPGVERMVAALARRPRGVPQLVQRYVVRAIRNRMVDLVQVVTAAQVGALAATDPVGLGWQEDLRKLWMEIRGVRMFLLDQVVRDLLRDGQVVLSADVVEEARDRLARLRAARTHRGDDLAAAREWWLRVGVTDTKLLAPLHRRFR